MHQRLRLVGVAQAPHGGQITTHRELKGSSALRTPLLMPYFSRKSLTRYPRSVSLTKMRHLPLMSLSLRITYRSRNLSSSEQLRACGWGGVSGAGRRRVD